MPRSCASVPCHGRAVERRIAKQSVFQEQRPAFRLSCPAPRSRPPPVSEAWRLRSTFSCRFRSLKLAIILALQISGSYELTLSIFRSRALALLAYDGLAIWRTCSWGG